MEKIKGFFSKCKNKISTVVATVFSVIALSVPAFAESSVDSAMTTALSTIKTDMLSVIGVVAPVGVSILGVLLVWKKGLSFFKSITGK